MSLTSVTELQLNKNYKYKEELILKETLYGVWFTTKYPTMQCQSKTLAGHCE